MLKHSTLRATLLLVAAANMAIAVRAQSFEKAVNAEPFSIEPFLRSSQLAQGEGTALVAVNALVGSLGDADMLLLKLDGEGQVTHDLTIGDVGGQGYHDVGMEVVQMGAAYYICGYTRSIDTAATPTFTSFLIKTDTALNFLWQKNYILPAPFEVYANAMTPTAEGQLLIAGQIYDGSDFNTMLMKVDADGIPLWTRQYTMDFGERVQCLRELPGGDVLLSGNVVLGFELVLPLAFKVNATGGFIWGRYYNYPPSSFVENSNFLFIEARSVDDILLCGHTDVLGVGGQDIYVVDVDSSGALNWARTYGSTQGEWPSAFQFDAAANELVVLGNTSSYSSSFTPTAMSMRIAPDGLLIDAELYGDTSAMQIASLTGTQRLSADRRLLTGWRSSPADDYYLAGVNNDLVNVCNTYAVSPDDPAQTTTTGTFPVVETTPTLLVNDLALGTSSFADLSTLCDSPTSIPEGGGAADQLIISPNPAVRNIHVLLGGDFASTQAIELQDVNGRVLFTQEGTGVPELWIDGSDLAAGVYMLRVLGQGSAPRCVRVVVERP